MRRRAGLRLALLISALLAAGGARGFAATTIVTDSSALSQGSSCGASCAAVGSGPSYTIPLSLGRQAGQNAFFSFLDFSVGAGDWVAFDRTGAPGIANFIARVTGGHQSRISGQVSAPANLYLFNPAGIVVGPGGGFNVAGSLHLSTAEKLTFADGAVLYADPARSVTLTTAQPAAFGFLGGSSGDIVIGDAVSTAPGDVALNVGGDLSLSGRNVTIATNDAAARAAWDIDASDPRIISAPGGRALLVAVGTAGGTIRLADGQFDATPGGTVSIRNAVVTGSAVAVTAGRIAVDTAKIGGASSVVMTAADSLDLRAATVRTGPAPGRIALAAGGMLSVAAGSVVESGNSADVGVPVIEIAAGRMLADNGVVRISAPAGSAGGMIRIIASGAVTLRNQGQINASPQGSAALAPGTVLVRAGRILIDGGGVGQTFISADGQSGMTGPSGGVTLEADGDVTVTGGGYVSGNTSGAGQGGAVVVRAADIVIDGAGGASFISSDALDVSTGNAANVTLEASGSVIVTGGGYVSSDTFGSAAAGSVTVRAGTIIIDGTGGSDGSTYIASTAWPGSTGVAGNVTLVASGAVTVKAGGIVSSRGAGSGNAGRVNVTASDIIVDGSGGRPSYTFISSDAYTDSQGQGGDVVLLASGTVTVRAGGIITTSTVGRGAAGNVVIRAGSIVIDGSAAAAGYSFVSSSALRGATGRAGDVTLDARDAVTVKGGGSVISDTYGSGDAGDITIRAATITVDGGGGAAAGDRSTTFISSSAMEGSSGDAGNLSIEAGGAVVVRDGGGIGTVTAGTGNAGTVAVAASDVLVDGRGRTATKITSNSIRATAGSAGEVTISGGNSVTIRDGGYVSTSSVSAAGSAGTVSIAAPRLTVTGAGSAVSSSSSGSGAAGDLRLSGREVVVSDGALVTTESARAGGGGIQLLASDLILVNQGQIVSSVHGGNGTAGNITLDPPTIVLNKALIQANADAGNGGNIFIVAGLLLTSPDTIIQATSQTGISGQISTSAQNPTDSSRLVKISTAYVDPSSRLVDPCNGAKQSRFSRAAPAALAAQPDDIVPLLSLGDRGASLSQGGAVTGCR